MVKLNNKRIKYIIVQSISGKKKIKDLAEIYKITPRHIRKLIKKYKDTGIYPILMKNRRPKTELSEEDKQLIDMSVKESLLTGAVSLRLYIEEYYNKKLPYNKIHKYLLLKGVSKEEDKKKKQRKYCRYERKHSFSLVHSDWHDSRAVTEKYVCVILDDASRLIICGGEYDDEKAEHVIKLMKKSIKIVQNDYLSTIREVNTDKGAQFYCNKNTKEGVRGRVEFEKYLEKKGINHIPSRRNHPQTNGKNERWFRTYEEKRDKFKSFEDFVDWYNNRLHLGLSRKKAMIPKRVVFNRLQKTSVVGLFWRLMEND